MGIWQAFPTSLDYSLTDLVLSGHGFLPMGRNAHPIAKSCIKWDLQTDREAFLRDSFLRRLTQ